MHTTTHEKPTHPNDVFDEMAQSWSAEIVPRTQKALDKFSGGLLCARTLANLDCLGKGPSERHRIGNKVVYSKWSLVQWLRERAAVHNENETIS